MVNGAHQPLIFRSRTVLRGLQTPHTDETKELHHDVQYQPRNRLTIVCDKPPHEVVNEEVVSSSASEA